MFHVFKEKTLKSRLISILSLFLFFPQHLFGQGSGPLIYQAGFKTLALVDTTRIYKNGTDNDDPLHYRTIELDIWYPSLEKSSPLIRFGDLFKLFEKRSSKYGNGDFSGMTEELAMLFLSEMGIDASPQDLLNAPTNSFPETEIIDGKLPLVIYMAGFNGMGFENYKVLERLAQEGFVVVSIWSVGGYPGNMSNKKIDVLEQVMDAEYALNSLKSHDEFSIDPEKIGVLGMSWGGMSSAVLVARNPEISAFISFDGSEIHYFGDQTDVDDNGVLNDDHIQEILETDLLKPANQHISYLYLESGKKLEEFTPTSEYNYYKLLNSDKRYLRFVESTHADFTSLPSILDTLSTAAQIHQQIIDVASHFLVNEFFNRSSFDDYWKNFVTEHNVTTDMTSYNLDNFNFEGNNMKGKIVDSKTMLPLPYVNIGLLHKQSGTVTDEDGQFELPFSADDLSDTLRISMIGYSSKKIILNDLKLKPEALIALDQKTESLEEVVVHAKGYVRRVLGNKTESKFISTGFGFDQLGAEMGIRIKIKKAPTFIDSLNFHVSFNRLSAKSIFRINFYTDENGKPGENLLKDNIFVEINPKQAGLISVDLTPFDIILLENAYVTLEWIKNEGVNKKGEAIFFSLGMFNSGTLYKPSSQARFKKHSSLGVGFNLNVRQ